MRVSAAAWAVLAVLLSGCTSAPPDRVPVGPPEDQQQTELTSPKDRFDLIAEVTPLEPPGGARYYSRDEAPRCPEVRLRAGSGGAGEVKPYAQGAVTIVVYWHVEAKRGVLAMVHADRLARKYRRFGTDAIGIVQKTRFGPRAPEVVEDWNATLPLYYDDVSMSALKKLGKAADAETWSAVPAFFITDGRGRIRYYQPGFSYSLLPGGPEDREDWKLVENAPEGQKLEDHLRRILSEE
ncbi:MAG: hypothetical protein R6V05_03365 [Candidatus Brocadiia bacterium]